MKRILSVILVMALLMCLGTSAFAATTMSASSTALQNGDKVYVTVALDAAMQDVRQRQHIFRRSQLRGLHHARQKGRQGAGFRYGGGRG